MSAKFIISREKVLRQYDKACELADYVSYSVKTNGAIAGVLEKNTDCEFSVHTAESLKLIDDKSRIWFFLQAHSIEEIRMLAEMGITRFVVDNESDVKNLMKALDDKKKISLLLRMKLKENTIQTGKHYVFGMRAEIINKLIAELKDNNKIENLGIHFHRKTQNVSEWSLIEELEQALTAETLNSIRIINIGGGIPVIYKNYQKAVLQPVFAKIKELRSWLNSKDIMMIIEPGRFIAAPAGVLETEIKAIDDNTIIVDASVYNSAMDTFVTHIRLLVDGELTAKEGEPYVIKGCTPDSIDIFRYRAFLKNPSVGDKIKFLNAGAYTYSSDFCNLKKIQMVIIK